MTATRGYWSPGGRGAGLARLAELRHVRLGRAPARSGAGGPAQVAAVLGHQPGHHGRDEGVRTFERFNV